LRNLFQVTLEIFSRHLNLEDPLFGIDIAYRLGKAIFDQPELIAVHRAPFLAGGG
jgi:hypothetical protein